jgi:3-deoxy-D-manno-octulosonic-acid transferase
MLDRLDLIAVQDESYAERFRRLGADPARVCVTGSMKYDGARSDRNNPMTRRLAALARFQSDDTVFLAGSTQEPEEELAVRAFRELSPAHPALRLAIAPRHPERFESVARMLAASGLPWQRRTNLDSGPADPAARILLIDTVGELGAWWGTASIAFVGGSLGQRGGQNMIEPAAYGAAVSFGPNTRNFRDVVSLILAHQAALVVADGQELTAFVLRCLDDPEFSADLGGRARTLVAQQLGATAGTVDLLEPLVSGRKCRHELGPHVRQSGGIADPSPSRT